MAWISYNATGKFCIGRVILISCQTDGKNDTPWHESHTTQPVKVASGARHGSHIMQAEKTTHRETGPIQRNQQRSHRAPDMEFVSGRRKTRHLSWHGLDTTQQVKVAPGA